MILEFWWGERSLLFVRAVKLLVLVTSCLLSIAGGNCTAQEPIDYARRIKPVLQARCYSCHGALKQEAGLRLDTVVLASRGGDSGAAIKRGDTEGSLLVQRVTSSDEATRMPPEGEPLKPAEIADLKAWIAQGAKGPADEQPELDPREHWAFRTPVRPPVPPTTWSTNPIDAFIAAEHQKRGIVPQKPADKRVWLRRVSLDLTGLPPSIAELEAFVADHSPDAYDHVVTRLLDSPLYGERWGRHWMDIWRYSDWWGLGAEVRNSQKHIWHWRDWIIESLNADKPYDQMLREMLAADELYPNDLDRLRASGFLARQYFKFNRTSWLDETIEHTSKAMLGLTFNCAKCHDHKYDPFSQQEYYRLRAIFEPYQIRTDAVPGEIDFEKDGIPRAFDCNLDIQTFLHVRGDDRNPDKSKVMEPGVPAFLSPELPPLQPVALPAEAFQPGTRPFVVEAHLKLADQRIEAATAALALARKKLTESVAAHQEMANTSVDDSPADALSVIARALFSDDFAAARPEDWETREGMWTYADGRLKQSAVGASRAALRLKKLPPADFEARFKYVPTGGEMWKSVGITFDVTADHEVLAYLSSVSGGSKSQIAYRQGTDAYVYPPGALQNRPVALNQSHEIVLRVRGTLVNIGIDGEHSIAYRLPFARQAGALELITFDASAEFLTFELNELSSAIQMQESSAAATREKPDNGPLPIDQAKLTVVIAEKSLVTAELQPLSIRARAAADRARWQEPTPSDLQVLIADAVRAERQVAMAKADEDLSRAELDVLKSPADKKADAVKKRDAAKLTLEAARRNMEAPGESFTALTGAFKTLESNLENEQSRSKPFPRTSSGRRTAFARWITDPRHPLPARVAVNHLWGRHFGRPLVPTVFDFGRKGTPPSHPELLDWLAVEFREQGWSMKHLHRLIVTSNTYRLTSSSTGATEATLAADPDNLYYWRANPTRMQAQLVRDSLLSLAGELDLTRGGPSIPVSNETSRRRSLYFVHSHNEHQKFLSIFDDASVLECYRRSESIVPQQALALENSSLASTMAEKIAQRMVAGGPKSDDEFVRCAFLTVLAVEPTSDELALVLESMAQLKAVAKKKNRPNPDQSVMTSVILILLNHNDFVTIR